MPQPLSSKEASLFRQVIKHYESKQNKKGLKAAEQILRKTPNHGDTLAMKALIYNAQGRSEEAFILAKEALRNDMKSHVCWHVYGLLYRAAKNLEEAIKAYKFALKLEPESTQIQRDLALLQVQMRDYQGYIISRRAMLKAKPHLRQNWTALAVAYHLAGELSEAEGILTTYEDTLKSPPPKTDLEHSEAVLYKNTIIAEMGNTEKALDHLEAACKNCLDKLAFMEMRAIYLLALGRKEEAEQAYRALIQRNPENREYYKGLVSCLDISSEDTTAMKAVYNEFAEKNPRNDAARWIPLGFLQGDSFREAADVYLRHRLHKGVPSTFANVKALYVDENKKRIIGELVEGYAKEITASSNTDMTETAVNGTSTKFESSVLYFLAQHYNYVRSRDLDKAMLFAERVTALDPKSVDYQMTKARIWKHRGDLSKASKEMERARLLDEKDRYINTKAAKYQLRNDENDHALETMSKFTRNDAFGGALGDLHDMQCVWYLTEDGLSYMRQQRYGLALKRFHAVFDIFEGWQEDQFDFHNFSFRKGMARAYVDMVRWEDHLRSHPYFSRAAVAAVTVYNILFNSPHLARKHSANGIQINGDSESAEKRKALKKAKKQQQKEDQAKADQAAMAKASKASPEGVKKKEDPDPKGDKLVGTSSPLDDALKFIYLLQEYCHYDMDVRLVIIDVALSKKNYISAAHMLLEGFKVEPENTSLHERLVLYNNSLDAARDGLEPSLFKIAESLVKEISSRET